MRTLKSILASILFSATALVMLMDLCCELPKIPALIKHYTEHQEVSNDTFWQFLLEDYAHQESGHDHHGEEEHGDLPFHGGHTCHHVPVVFSGSLNYSFVPSTLFVESGNCTCQSFFSSIYQETPFQPPQLA